MRKRTLCLFLLLLLCACATLPVLPPETPSAESLLQQINARWQALQGLKGLAQVRVSLPQKNFSTHEVFLVHRPAFLRMELLGPLGTPQFYLVTDGRDLKVYNPGENRYYHGQATADHLFAALPFIPLPLKPEEAVALLLGGLPVSNWETVSIGRDQQEPRWILDLTSASLGESQRLWIHPQSFQILRAELHRPGLSAHLTFSDFREIKGVLFPQRIQFTATEPQVQISIAYEEPELNPPWEEQMFQLPVPRGATVIPLK